MKQALVAIALSLLPVTGAYAASIDSAYTDIDSEKTCKKVQDFGEEDAAELECSGYKDYRVYLHYGDARESIDYGSSGKPLFWESFPAFNHSGPKIEWRLEDGRPFATIHRWFVSVYDEDGSETDQYLVVKTVGQPGGPAGCAVAVIKASGNAKANEQARQIADDKARGFKCGDAVISVGGDAGYSRTETDN